MPEGGWFFVFSCFKLSNVAKETQSFWTCLAARDDATIKVLIHQSHHQLGRPVLHKYEREIMYGRDHTEGGLYLLLVSIFALFVWQKMQSPKGMIGCKLLYTAFESEVN